MSYQYRNWQKRIIFKDACYFVTFYTKDRFPYFKEKIFCDLFVENLKICKSLKDFKLYGWVICYEHVHLQIQPGDEHDVSKVMQFLKRNVSRNINFIMGYNQHDETFNTSESDIDQCHFQTVYRFVFRKFMLKFRFKIKYLNQNFFLKFRWQKSFHDHYIRNENDFDEHMEYIANNLHKHHLPDYWKYIFTDSEYEDLIDEC